MICSKCNIDKSINEFEVRSDTGKLRGQCKECRKQYCREYHRKRILEYRKENPSKVNSWTKEEIQYIKEHAKNKTYLELSIDLNRTKLSVERKVTRLQHIKVKRCPHKEWHDDKVKYLQKNEGKKTYYELSNDLKKSVISIRKKMHKLNIEPKQHSKYKEVNHDFFKIWSEEMVYILGLWFADGCITSNGKKKYNSNFIFNISSKDLKILEKIKNIMCSTYKIHKNIKKLNGKEFYTYGFTVCSKQIYNDIIKLGGYERKSLILKFPNIPNEYARHFIRGYFDGDGAVRCDYKHRNYPSINFPGTYDFLSKLMTYFHYREKIKHIGNIYQIDYHGEKSQDILKYMYENATIYLNRKYERYQDAMKWFKVNYHWTKNDIKILKEKYPENSYCINELLERHTKGSIRTKACQLNIKTKKLNQNVLYQKV